MKQKPLKYSAPQLRISKLQSRSSCVDGSAASNATAVAAAAGALCWLGAGAFNNIPVSPGCGSGSGDASSGGTGAALVINNPGVISSCVEGASFGKSYDATACQNGPAATS
jgi:hypothetical protein